MTDSELYTTWGIALGIAAVVVLIAAALLIAIILTARSILTHAREAEATVARIADHTGVVWALDQTNDVVASIESEASRIDDQTERIANALEHRRAGGGR
jgi:hypothetical protein